MELILKAKLSNIYKNQDFTDKGTGEVNKGKYQLQFLTERSKGEGLGSEMILEKVSIPDELYPRYKDKVGQDIELKVGSMVTGPDQRKHKVIFYGIKL